MFFFILITCLFDFVLIWNGEILRWSLMGVQGLNLENCNFYDITLKSYAIDRNYMFYDAYYFN